MSLHIMLGRAENRAVPLLYVTIFNCLNARLLALKKREINEIKRVYVKTT